MKYIGINFPKLKGEKVKVVCKAHPSMSALFLIEFGEHIPESYCENGKLLHSGLASGKVHPSRCYWVQAEEVSK